MSHNITPQENQAILARLFATLEARVMGNVISLAIDVGDSKGETFNNHS